MIRQRPEDSRPEPIRHHTAPSFLLGGTDRMVRYKRDLRDPARELAAERQR